MRGGGKGKCYAKKLQGPLSKKKKEGKKILPTVSFDSFK